MLYTLFGNGNVQVVGYSLLSLHAAVMMHSEKDLQRRESHALTSTHADVMKELEEDLHRHESHDKNGVEGGQDDE